MNGGSAQFIYNFNKWFSGVADLGAVHRGNVAVLNVDDRRAFFMAGPRLSYRTSSRWTPYFEVLFGASRRSVSNELSVVTGPNTPALPVVTPHDLFPGPGVEITAEVSASQTDFAMATGGGVDVRISKRFTFRPIAVDYLYTTFPSLVTGKGSSQNGLRATIGFTFTFGAE
jgi:opacity protein-like surface antigen